ncbi:MAG TPA: hypothetical protein VF068_14805 [Rubrobacter sp.]
MSGGVPPSRKALSEALGLSSEILKNIELSELPLTNIALKASRLARLLNDFDIQRIMAFEVGGYPQAEPNAVSPDVWRLAVAAGRKFNSKDSKTGEFREHIYGESIGVLEEQLRLGETSLAAARDPDVSLTSANPNQYVHGPIGNQSERQGARALISTASQRLASRRAFVHDYTLRKHYELKLSDIADDVFTRTRDRVDSAIGESVPDSIQRLSAVYENLQSENPEDWSNAVHSCRRILQDLADAVFPPRDEDRIVIVNGKKQPIKLGKNNYINRIIAFVEDSSQSERYKHLVGSHLRFIGERLDSLFKAAQKGSHDTIVSREEADRYVIYTYLIVGDILSLRESSTKLM